VFVPVDARHARMMENPWRDDDVEFCWRPEVESTGRNVAVPVSDVVRIVGLQHKHIPMTTAMPGWTMADVLRHLKNGLPAGAGCCGIVRGRGFQCETSVAGSNVYTVVGRSSGRPWRLETMRKDTAIKASTSD